MKTNKTKKKRKTFKILLISFVLLILVAAIILLLGLISKPSFSYYCDSEGVRIDIKDKNIFNRKFWISVDDNESGQDSTNWELYEDKSYTLQPGVNYIHIKDQFGRIVEADEADSVVANIQILNDFYPLYPVGQTIELETELTSIGKNPMLYTRSSDDSIASIDNGIISCKSPGTASIELSSGDLSQAIEITVTDLYTLPDENSDNKPFLNKTICTKEQATLLDEVLERKINEAGNKTRAGVVAAARFLALEFPYRLAYFSESGRLDPLSSLQCDGEGRYYHKGLYLSENKFAEIEKSIYGPAYWGQYFLEDTTDDHSLDDYYMSGGFTPADIGSSLYLMKRPNGLDCSGHVSWCYYNGGFDLGDLGAGGPGGHGMNELGELVYISDELLQSDRIKAGDLIGYPSHIGIVIGVDEKHIWISDANVSGLKNVCYEKTAQSFAEIYDESPWQYFILMDLEYINDGNYTPMW